MTNEISNKTLAFLLVGAIVVSLFGTFISLNKLNKISDFGLGGITGLYTDTGQVTLDVVGLESFTVSALVDFNNIVPNATTRWISTNSTNSWAGPGATDCTSGASACQGLTIENDGNQVLNLSFNTTSNAASFIGGTAGGGPNFKFFAREGNETNGEDGCTGGMLYNASVAGMWTEIAADTDYEICTGNSGVGFDFTANLDKVTLEFNLTVPTDAPQATKTATITIFNT